MSILAEELLERFGKSAGLSRVGTQVRPLPLAWAEINEILPDRGLPRGVIELRAPHALGGSTSIALSAVRGAQGDERAWCAWVDPDGALYAPGVAMAGVDLNRLAVVRPPRKALFRIATTVVRSRAFDVVVVDMDALPGAQEAGSGRGARGRVDLRTRRFQAEEVFVRRLAMLSVEAGTTVLLLTDASLARAAPLPVALRLELSQTEQAIRVAVGKERRGRVGLAKTVPLHSRPTLELTG